MIQSNSLKRTLGYNKHSVITNKKYMLVGLGHFYDEFSVYYEQNPVVVNKIRQIMHFLVFFIGNTSKI